MASGCNRFDEVCDNAGFVIRDNPRLMLSWLWYAAYGCGCLIVDIDIQFANCASFSHEDDHCFG